MSSIMTALLLVGLSGTLCCIMHTVYVTGAPCIPDDGDDDELPRDDM